MGGGEGVVMSDNRHVWKNANAYIHVLMYIEQVHRKTCTSIFDRHMHIIDTHVGLNGWNTCT